ncbi:uncharacterized protein LOC109608812 [Aethina tumida]|uniref:uncharacterized protein LOC109608812 n=1 Tax=Aethina tumida TaxID=116153 RepID=UPI002147EE26|nr:uncharacterized protein LOC109608812 [Aethina tumida]
MDPIEIEEDLDITNLERSLLYDMGLSPQQANFQLGDLSETIAQLSPDSPYEASQPHTTNEQGDGRHLIGEDVELSDMERFILKLMEDSDDEGVQDIRPKLQKAPQVQYLPEYPDQYVS